MKMVGKSPRTVYTYITRVVGHAGCRTRGLSDTRVVGHAGWTRGLSDTRVVGHAGCRTRGLSDTRVVGHAGCQVTLLQINDDDKGIIMYNKHSYRINYCLQNTEEEYLIKTTGACTMRLFKIKLCFCIHPLSFKLNRDRKYFWPENHFKYLDTKGKSSYLKGTSSVRRTLYFFERA